MKTEVRRFLALSLGLTVPLLLVLAAAGESALARQGAYSMTICLVLGALSLETSLRALHWGPLWQMGVVLGGTIVRAGLALAAGILLFWLVPVCRAPSFFMCLGMSYLVCLGFEVAFLTGALRRSFPFPRCGQGSNVAENGTP